MPGAWLVGNQIKDLATGRCLDSNPSGSAYTTNPCQTPGNLYQDWMQDPNTNEFYDYATGLYLDSNTSGNVYTGKHNGGSYQNWWHIW
jgi:serine/threonine-protein kinase